MKIRSLLLLTLLISFAAILQVKGSSRCNTGPTTELNQKSPAVNYSGKIIASFLSDSQGDHGSSGKEPDSLIVQSPDAAINCSVIPVSNVILSLIAVLHLQQVEEFRQPVNIPNQQAFFKILFRVIIAPNAP